MSIEKTSRFQTSAFLVTLSSARAVQFVLLYISSSCGLICSVASLPFLCITAVKPEFSFLNFKPVHSTNLETLLFSELLITYHKMSFSFHCYPSEQARALGIFIPGCPPISTPTEGDRSNSTETSDQATWSPESLDRSYIMTPSFDANIPAYYSGRTQVAAAPTGPLWELQEQYQPTESLPQKRQIVKQKKSSPESNEHACLFPGCTTPKPFRRAADLERHKQQFHDSPDPSRQFFCDYPRCNRAVEPHTRKDHFRDHLRDTHSEDIPKRVRDPNRGKGNAKGKSVSGNPCGRRVGGTITRFRVSDKWWRCSKCLKRKFVAEGWYCVECKRRCEDECILNRSRIHKGSSKRPIHSAATNSWDSRLNFRDSPRCSSSATITTTTTGPLPTQGLPSSPAVLVPPTTYPPTHPTHFTANNTTTTTTTTPTSPPPPITPRPDPRLASPTPAPLSPSSPPIFNIKMEEISLDPALAAGVAHINFTTTAPTTPGQYKSQTACRACNDFMVWVRTGWAPCFACGMMMGVV